MKIAISLRENETLLNSILHTLERKGFKVSRSSSIYTIWIYGLKLVDFSNGYIQLEKEDLTSMIIYMDSINRFEVHKED